MPFVAIITIALMALVTVGLIGWDVFVAFNKIPNSIDTISGRMKAWGKQTILLPWLWAGLFGHFWGPIRAGQLLPMKTGLPLLLFLTWGVLLLGTVLRHYEITITSSWILFFLILNLGAVAGASLWPQ